MFTPIVEFTALVIFMASFWHAARSASHAFAQQWFTAGYLAAILRETILQTAFRIYFFAPMVLKIGAAPALITLLSPSLYYLAYQFALRFVPPEKTRQMLALVFLIAASIGLPLEATAVQAHWWTYGEPTAQVVFGAPIVAPLIWGGSAVIFCAAFARIHRTPLPDRGKLYAAIAFAPVVAALQVIWILLLSLMR